MRFVITFVCQRGELEAKAALLAASLRRHLDGAADLVARLPTPETAWGRPGPETLRVLERLGVTTAAVPNAIDETYPIGNKIGCLDIPAGVGRPLPDRVVFLDSDILCMARFAPARHFAADFCVKPADVGTFAGGSEEWSRLYRLFGLAETDRRIRATVSGEEMWPYFNAGVVGVRADAGLAAAWAECCRRIDAEAWVPSRRPHLDQIALPIAAAQRGLEATLLDETLNFPAHFRPVRPAPPVLCHYHDAGTVGRDPRLLHEVNSLVEDHPDLRPVLESQPAWQPLLRPARRRWWPARRPAWWPGAARVVEPPAAPNDIPAAALAAALGRSETPDLLQTLVDVSRRRFGWFTRHPSRAVEYPWVVDRLSGLRSGRVVDVGAGVSPVPLLLALRGLQVTTVDDSLVVRVPAGGTAGWDEWGYLDYAAFDAGIRSIHGDATDLDLPEASCAAAYSISVVEHMPAETRRRLWPRLAGWLAPGGQLLLTFDLVAGTDLLWNRASGREVEPTGVHGDLPALVAELARCGCALDERIDLRALPDMRADVALLAFVKAPAPAEVRA